MLYCHACFKFLRTFSSCPFISAILRSHSCCYFYLMLLHSNTHCGKVPFFCVSMAAKWYSSKDKSPCMRGRKNGAPKLLNGQDGCSIIKLSYIICSLVIRDFFIREGHTTSLCEWHGYLQGWLLRQRHSSVRRKKSGYCVLELQRIQERRIRHSLYSDS